MRAYDELMAFQRESEALGQVAGRLSWDQETMMAPGSGAQRAEEMGALEAVLHTRRTDPRVGDWLTVSEADVQNEIEAAQLRLIRHSYDRVKRVPGDLAVALARVTSTAQGKWAEARASDDFAAFAPVLEEVLALKREEGAALANGGDVYDALIEDYEPETSASDLQAMFDAMRPGLVALRQAALDRLEAPSLQGTFDLDGQLALSRELAQVFGYDLNRGRLDLAVHPFSSGSGDDVRITTRVSEHDPFNCLYSTIHEVGHACYEQNIDHAYHLTPAGKGVSMGVHESQSRIFENQLGRSRPFCHWLFGRMTEVFGDYGIKDADDFYACVNRVHRGYIRTEADEVQYNLHIMLRFDLERALVSGDLQVNDLEAAWNDRFKADFGYDVEKASDGCLQDVHWSVGLFGYFPTYALGNVYAGCLYQALRQEIPDLDTQLGQGDLTSATTWLRENLQQHGGRFRPQEVIAKASGKTPDSSPLMTYLEQKFSALYSG
ncbi:Thermostable carboxypeptidase 1 [Roseovarius albus]|uniref:Metal-dependent carboxypeptidase n=1 Tax=Roseovarius albus TaxID=1247867 RepID=A0A1X6YYM8_9RHOB|nr:carboxypeptidase M32 [Roseovarius albus]SLN34636.1 Thermostable carboxypeptidase 1 [Roseovarius albus]